MPSTTSIRNTRDLIVWQRAIELVLETYRLTESFPKREIYGLAAQMRSAAVSIPANIAEGRGRYTRAEYIRFITIAIGSLRELETYGELCTRLAYSTTDRMENFTNLAGETGAMLVGLCKALRSKT